MKNYLSTTFFLLLFVQCIAQKAGKKPTETANLKAVYSQAFKMGCALNEAIVSGEDKVSQDLVKKHFNAITVENVMKAALVNPEPGVFKWQPAVFSPAVGVGAKVLAKKLEKL